MPQNPAIPIPGFCGPSYKSNPINIGTERAINIYAELAGERFERSTQSFNGFGMQSFPTPKANYIYRGAPGTSLLTTLGSGPGRGMLELNDSMHFVSGANYYLLNSSDVPSAPVAVANDSKPVSMMAMANQVYANQFALASAGSLYVNTGGGLVLQAGPWTSAVQCALLDTYGMVLDNDGSANGGKIFYSAPGDFTSWSALDFITVDISANKLIAIVVDFRQLWVFGTTRTQVFYVSGGSTGPIAANLTGVVQMGIAAKDSVAVIDNTRFWLGKDQNGNLLAVRAEGYIPVRISTHAIEQIWQAYSNTDVGNAFAWTFQMGGHSFIQWSFPGVNGGKGASWRFDTSTEQWHEVANYPGGTFLEEGYMHRGSCHAFKQGRHLLGDHTNGKIWILSPDYTYDDASVTAELIYMRRTCPILSTMNRYNRFDSVELDIEMGGSFTSGQTAAMRYSNDAGHNYTSYSTQEVGVGTPASNYLKRMRWTRCGTSRNRVFDFRTTTRACRSFIGGYMQVQPGTR